MKIYPEVHQQGLISICQNFKAGGLMGDFGIQVAADGRIWICIDGIAAIRFKPLTKETLKNMEEYANDIKQNNKA